MADARPAERRHETRPPFVCEGLKRSSLRCRPRTGPRAFQPYANGGLPKAEGRQAGGHALRTPSTEVAERLGGVACCGSLAMLRAGEPAVTLSCRPRARLLQMRASPCSAPGRHPVGQNGALHGGVLEEPQRSAQPRDWPRPPTAGRIATGSGFHCRMLAYQPPRHDPLRSAGARQGGFTRSTSHVRPPHICHCRTGSSSVVDHRPAYAGLPSSRLYHFPLQVAMPVRCATGRRGLARPPLTGRSPCSAGSSCLGRSEVGSHGRHHDK
jgi:hypothetical protein